MKYAFMRAHARQFPVKAMCRVLDLARSGYYAWCSRKPSQRRQRQAQLDRLVGSGLLQAEGA